jgi:hypothetical protein
MSSSDNSILKIEHIQYELDIDERYLNSSDNLINSFVVFCRITIYLKTSNRSDMISHSSLLINVNALDLT